MDAPHAFDNALPAKIEAALWQPEPEPFGPKGGSASAPELADWSQQLEPATGADHRSREQGRSVRRLLYNELYLWGPSIGLGTSAGGRPALLGRGGRC